MPPPPGNEPLTREQLRRYPEETTRPPAPTLAPYYKPERRMREGLIVVGGLLFVGTYMINVSVAVDKHLEYGSQYMPIPLVGPFLAAAAPNRYPCGFSPPQVAEDCNSPMFTEALIFDGVIENLGAGLLMAGVLWKKRYWVRLDALGATVGPLVTGRRLGVAGSF